MIYYSGSSNLIHLQVLNKDDKLGYTLSESANLNPAGVISIKECVIKLLFL